MVSSRRFTRQVDVAVAPILADDDRLIAGARVLSGPPPLPVAFGAVLAGGALASAATTLTRLSSLSAFWHVLVAVVIVATVPPCIQLCLQRPMFIAVSRQQLICARLTAFRQRPVRTLTASLSVATIDDYSLGSWSTSITLTMPGRRRPLRLHGFRRRQTDLDQVLMWAATAGIPIASKRDQTTDPASHPWASSPPQWSRWPDG
jgi:hypothetical protein